MRIYCLILIGISAFLIVIFLQSSIVQARDFIVYSPSGVSSLAVNGSSGFVGIGTPKPMTNLHVQGSQSNARMVVDASGAGEIILGSNTKPLNQKYYYVYSDGSKLMVGTIYDDLSVHVYSLVLDRSGRMGLGGVYSPQSTLAVRGGMAVGGYATSEAAAMGDIITSGNIGIGTTTPVSRLQVEGNITLNNSLNYAHGNNSIRFDNLGNIIMQLG